MRTATTVNVATLVANGHAKFTTAANSVEQMRTLSGSESGC